MYGKIGRRSIFQVSILAKFAPSMKAAHKFPYPVEWAEHFSTKKRPQMSFQKGV